MVVDSLLAEGWLESAVALDNWFVAVGRALAEQAAPKSSLVVLVIAAW